MGFTRNRTKLKEKSSLKRLLLAPFELKITSKKANSQKIDSYQANRYKIKRPHHLIMIRPLYENNF